MFRTNEYHPDRYAEYLNGPHRYNMVVLSLDVGFLMFGLSMVSMSVVLPTFAVRLGASNMVIGLLPAFTILGWRLPQIATSFFAEGRLRHKPYCLLVGIPGRVPWLAMGVFTLLIAGTNPSLLLALLLTCVLVANLSFGLTGPSWGELIARAIPSNRRGIFMAAITVMSGGFGVLGGLYVKFVMKSGLLAYPTTYAVLFFSASVLMWISYVFFAIHREPILFPARPEKDLATYFRSLPRILVSDHNYRRFLISHLLASSRVMGLGFFMAHAIKRFSLGDEAMGGFVMASAGATLLVSPLLGLLGDRLGHKLNQGLTRAFYVAAALIAAVAWDWRIMYPVFALMAAGMAAGMVSEQNLIYHFAPTGKRPTYLALASTLSAPFVLGFALLGGWLAGYPGLDYRVPFLLSAALNLVSLGVLIFGVKVPDLAPLPPAPQEPEQIDTPPAPQPVPPR